MALTISGGDLGYYASSRFCRRCAWVRLHVKPLPYQSFPGIFSSIDRYNKLVVNSYFERHGSLPSWLSGLGQVEASINPPHWSAYSVLDADSGVTLRGEADAIFKMSDGSYTIVDYKTSRYTPGKRGMFRNYEVQLNSYAYIGERLDFSPVTGLALAYMEPVTDEETAVMLKALDRAKSDNLRTLILLAVTSGMRRGEMLGLHWSGVDFPAEADGTTGTIKVEWSLEETKDGLRLKEPKTESSLRTIEIPPMTVQALRQHRAWQAEYRMKLGRPDGDWLVFETPEVHDTGTVEFRPWRPRNVTKAFGLFIKRTPVTKITLHGLRHTHITSALMAGENIKVVSERAGHSGVQITLDTYGHVIGGKDRDIAVSHEQRLMAYLGKR